MDWAAISIPATALVISISTFVFGVLTQKQTRSDLHHKAEAEYVEKLGKRTTDAEDRLRACELERADFRARINALEDALHTMRNEMRELEDSHLDASRGPKISA